jgi:predicted ATPase/signal transduction histidine kinase
MLLLSDYNILEKISLNGNKLIYRAERYRDSQKVILKILENMDSEYNQVDQIANEYEIGKNISFKRIPKYLELETYHNRHIAVLEYVDGISLDKYMRESKPQIGTSIKIAIGITEVLQYFFQKGLVHQDLTPARFLVDPKSLEVYLIDFSIASRVTGKNRTVEHPSFCNESLAYISPEQTGQIKAKIDICTDLYSVGAILYEMVMGKAPFETNETTSNMLGHIKKHVEPPHISNINVPVTLSKIIIKLLSKHAGDRYQSPPGLKVDLEKCLNQWVNYRTIELFEPGQHDFPCTLQDPNQFYGRDKEITLLQHAFNQLNTGKVQIVLIEGCSGIGKSALVHKLKNSVQLQSETFVEGKFHQFKTNIPYFAFIQAFEEFTDCILAQSKDKIAVWKDRILKAVGVNGKVLTDVIPHLKLLLGPQPAVPELEPNETQNRFNYIFINFIKSISQKDYPLIVFFDDLQWSDAASLNLLRTIVMEKDLKSFLFIGAYRDNEMATNTMFSACLEDIQKEGCVIQKMLLSPLPHKTVNDIICETLGWRMHHSPDFVNLVSEKSQGNPFFINAFVKSLYAENILIFNFHKLEWNCDLAQINKLKFSDDIVELMTGRIQKLPETTQELLKVAACLGYNFELHLLKVIREQTIEEIKENLKPAFSEGLVLSTGNSCRFMHDRIQQAAYSLIPDSEKNRTHLNIGTTLFENLCMEDRDTYIFEVVNQFNAGIDSIFSQEKRHNLAVLNLTASIRAKSSAAYKTSYEYLQTGISLLSSEAWNNQYELALQLYTEGAESAFLCGSYGQMEEWIDVVLTNTSNVLDKVRVFEVKIKSFTARQRLLDAVQTALQILDLLNVKFPRNANKIHVFSALLKIKLSLLGKSMEKLVDLPLIKNPYAEAAIRLLAIVGSAVYFAIPKLFPLFVCKAFSLMIKYGNSPYSGVVCVSYGIIMIGGIGDIDTGYRLGKIAMEMSERFKISSFKSQCIMMVYNFILHWKEHTKDILDPLSKSYRSCLETGNTEFASYNAMVYCFHCFFCGKNLKELSAEMMHYIEAIQQLRQETALNLHKIHTQAILNLQIPLDDPTLLTGEVLDEECMLQVYKETRAETALFDVYFFKLILSFLFEKYDLAQTNAREAKKRIESVTGSTEGMIFYFYETLTHLALIRKHSGQSKKHLLKNVYRNLKRFRKFVRFSPKNCSHKLYLIEAELFAVTGRLEKAAQFYDKAIEGAKSNEYLNDLALSCELAGQFYHFQGREFIAQHYILQAYKFYQDWGALAKAKHIEKKYPYILDRQRNEHALGNFKFVNEQKGSSTMAYLGESSFRELDLQSIMKAAAAISSEIQLDKLLKTLVKIAVENAGAKQGYLILKKDTGFFIEAEGSINTKEQILLQSVPIKGNKLVSEAIVQFVYLTKENLVIDNAIHHPHFSLDPIIIEKGAKSVLCIPIINQGDVVGILYFENDLIANAFTQSHIELLRLLSGQMAIALQNALNEQKKTNAFIERENLQRQINSHHRELLKTKLEIQEQTYHNISEELHDNIGQVLTLIKLNINTINVNEPGIAKEKLLQSKTLLAKVIQDVRDLTKTLNTDFIDKIGLADAIEQQLQFLRKTDLYFTKLLVKGEVTKYESQRELVIFRIVQELLNNVVKHAEATSIQVTMEYQNEKLVITVHDNGKGFDFQKQLPSNKGIGLRNIHNRISLIKGAVSFKSEPESGTTATFEVIK